MREASRQRGDSLFMKVQTDLLQNVCALRYGFDEPFAGLRSHQNFYRCNPALEFPC